MRGLINVHSSPPQEHDIIRRMKVERDQRNAKANPSKPELRTEYQRSDFLHGLVRGKYAKQLKESSNIVTIKPEVARVSPNEDSVNNALLSLIDIATKTVGPRKRKAAPKKRG